MVRKFPSMWRGVGPRRLNCVVFLVESQTETVEKILTNFRLAVWAGIFGRKRCTDRSSLKRRRPVCWCWILHRILVLCFFPLLLWGLSSSWDFFSGWKARFFSFIGKDAAHSTSMTDKKRIYAFMTVFRSIDWLIIPQYTPWCIYGS